MPVVSREAPRKALPRDSMTKRVTAAIRNEILNGNYKLGQKLRENELADQFNVSNIVIREAFHTLQGEGIVVVDPYRARYVFDITEEDYRDLIVARASLESLAAYLATKRLDDEWAEKISVATAKFRDTNATNFAELAELDLNFHRTVWQAAKNEWVFKQLSRLVFPLYSLNTLHFIEPDLNFEEALGLNDLWEGTTDPPGHRWVAQCLLSGNPDEARKSMIVHVMVHPSLADLRKEFFQI